MYARLSRFAGLPPERIEETIKEFQEQALPGIEQQKGFAGFVLGVDWNGGRAAAVSFWETREDLEASDRLAAQARDQAAATAEAPREPIVDNYEVVIKK